MKIDNKGEILMKNCPERAAAMALEKARGGEGRRLPRAAGTRGDPLLGRSATGGSRSSLSSSLGGDKSEGEGEIERRGSVSWRLGLEGSAGPWAAATGDPNGRLGWAGISLSLTHMTEERKK